MNVIVDRERNFQVQGEPKDVLAVVVAASQWLREKGRVIVSINVDGQSVSPESMAKDLKGRSLDDVNSIEIASDDVHTLVSTSLKELQEVLPELPNACHDIAEVFQSEEPEAGFDPFHRLAEIWGHVKVRQTQVAHALELDLDMLEVNGTSLKELHEELNGFLAEAADALEAWDCVTLGDLLEYELAPRAETEAAIVAVLQEQAARPAG